MQQILFEEGVALQQMPDEEFRHVVVLVQHERHETLVEPVKDAIGDRTRRGDAQPLSYQATLAEEFTRRQRTDDGFLASSRNDREFLLAPTDIEYRISNLALAEDGVPCAAFDDRLYAGDPGEEGFPINGMPHLFRPENLHFPTGFPFFGKRPCDHSILLH